MEAPPGRYRAISAGREQIICALTEAGESSCWGWDEYNLVLRADPPPGRYATVSAGTYTACALTDMGEARCWGREWFGSREERYGEESYGSVEPPPGRYTAISVSTYRACALTEAGEVVCWGDVSYRRWPYLSPI